VGLSIGCCSSVHHLLHVYNVEALVLKAVGKYLPLACLGEGEGLLPS
jgi:hypothetical protein